MVEYFEDFFLHQQDGFPDEEFMSGLAEYFEQREEFGGEERLVGSYVCMYGWMDGWMDIWDR